MGLELVTVETSDGVLLSGTWRRLEGSAPPRLGIDALILHHGTGGAFYRSPPFGGLVEQRLLEEGCAVLRVNNRGHDFAYAVAPRLLGSAFEVVDDCRHDWKAWIDFAASAGYRRIALWGHSLGAVKSIYYMATEGDPRVACVIGSSPPRFSYSDYMAKDGSYRFKDYFDRARELVEHGDPEALMRVTIPLPQLVTARAYIDKYGPEERYDILKHLPKVPAPILVTIGGEEGVVPQEPLSFGLGGLAAKVAELAQTTSNLTFELIPGASHGYLGKEGELWETVRSWLERLRAAAREVRREN